MKDPRTKAITDDIMLSNVEHEYVVIVKHSKDCPSYVLSGKSGLGYRSLDTALRYGTGWFRNSNNPPPMMIRNVITGEICWRNY